VPPNALLVRRSTLSGKSTIVFAALWATMLLFTVATVLDLVWFQPSVAIVLKSTLTRPGPLLASPEMRLNQLGRYYTLTLRRRSRCPATSGGWMRVLL
jgi:hypothetical protein